MAASAWLIHDKIKLYVGQKLVDFDTDDFRCNLYLSTSNIATLSINALSTATNQVATAGGYTQDAKVADNPTWTESAGVVTFNCDDIVWTASGSGITARFAAIWDNTVASPVADPIVCHTLLDTTPADVFAASGNAFTIEIHADGVFESV
jgi:hypothetical protein